MSLFLSTFQNKVDTKGRISVPASFRTALVSESFRGIVLFRSYKFSAIEGCGLTRMQTLSDSMDALEQFSDEQDDLAATIFADAHQLPFDSEGRILLPPNLIEHAHLQEKAAFVGRGNTFQIWNPGDFQKHQLESRKRAGQKGATLRLHPQSASPQNKEGNP